MRKMRLSENLMVIDMSEEEAERLNASVIRTTTSKHKSGGFQNLQKHWVENLNKNRITLTDPVWIERTIRYTTRYGDGGFEGSTGGSDRYGPNGVRGDLNTFCGLCSEPTPSKILCSCAACPQCCRNPESHG